MKLTILGSGTGIPSLQRGAPGHLIHIDNEPLLFDSGSGTLLRLLKVGVDYKQLNHVFYTHTHSDHTADLIPLIQALRTTPNYKRTERFHIYGPAGFRNFLQILTGAFGAWLLDPSFPVEIHELKRDQLNFPEYSIKTIPVQHSQAAISYRVESREGHSIVYSGDTDYCQEIIELAKGADVLILECSFPDNRKMKGHLTPSEAGEIAKQANCGHLILTHLYPPVDELKAEIKIKCPKIFGGKISIAHDDLKLKFES